MAWYNRWSDFTGDVNDIVHGRNPMNKPPPVPIPPGGPTGSTPGQVYPVGSHASGGNIQNTGGVNPTGVSNPMTTTPSGGTGDTSGEDVPWWKRVGEFALDHAGDIIAVGAGAGAAYEGYKNSQMSSELMKEGIDMAKQDYASRGQFRDAAAPMMLDPRTPDLSSLFANSGNPYAKGRQVPVVGKRAVVPTDPDTDAHRIPTGTGSTTTVNYGGKQYTQAEWEAYKQANPNWGKPTTPGQQTSSGTRMVPSDPTRIPSVGRGR